MNYTDQEWTHLWCACKGNSSEIPFHGRIEEKLKKLHESAWSQGMIYISVVLTLYIVGLTLIVMRSGHERRPLSNISLSCLMPVPSRVLQPKDSKKSSIFRLSKKYRDDKTIEMDAVCGNCTTPNVVTPAIKVTVESSPEDTL